MFFTTDDSSSPFVNIDSTNSYIMAPAVRRPVRVGGASGGFSDRVRAISSLAKDDVDVIVGDWLSEMTMTVRSV